MKTSNKLLLGALAVVLISISTTIYLSKTLIYSHTSTTSARVESVSQELMSFHEIQVEGNIIVNIIQSHSYGVAVKAPKDLLSLIKTEVEDGKLHVYTRLARLPDSVAVDINVPNLTSLNVSANARVLIDDEFKSDSIVCVCSSGSALTGNLLVNKLSCNSSSGAVVNLTGKTNYLSLNASSGAVVNASSFEAEQCSLEGSTGAVLNINVTKQLDVNVSTGCVANYRGGATMGNTNVTTGATLNKGSAEN